MNGEVLDVDCAEWLQVAQEYPAEMAVVLEMMIEAEEENCFEEAA